MTTAAMPNPGSEEGSDLDRTESGPDRIADYPVIFNSRGIIDQVGPIVVRCPVDHLVPGLPEDVPYDPRVYDSPAFGIPIVLQDDQEHPHVLIGEEYVKVAGMRNLDEILVEFVGKRPLKETLLAVLRHEVIARRRPPSELGKLATKAVRAAGPLTLSELANKIGFDVQLAQDLLCFSDIEPLFGEHLRAGTLLEGHTVTLCPLENKDFAQEKAEEAVKRGLSVRDLQTDTFNAVPAWDWPDLRRFWHRWLPQEGWWQDFTLEHTDKDKENSK